MADPFEVRMDFLKILKRGLDAFVDLHYYFCKLPDLCSSSQRSIQIAINHALLNFPRCGEDLWNCIIEALEEVSINQRMNIFYFLDSLCDACRSDNVQTTANRSTKQTYIDLLSRDLKKVVTCVTPEGRAGLPNLTSVKKILDTWQSKRIVDPSQIASVIATLNTRAVPEASPEETSAHPDPNRQPSHATSTTKAMPRDEIFKRIEADRERHKRLREKRWVQPIPQSTSAGYQLASCFGQAEHHADAEFEDAWENTSDWNEDDIEAAAEEDVLCFPAPAQMKAYQGHV